MGHCSFENGITGIQIAVNLHQEYEGVLERQRRLYLSLTGLKADKGVSYCHGQVKRGAFYIIPLTLSPLPTGRQALGRGKRRGE